MDQLKYVLTTSYFPDCLSLEHKKFALWLLAMNERKENNDCDLFEEFKKAYLAKFARWSALRNPCSLSEAYWQDVVVSWFVGEGSALFLKKFQRYIEGQQKSSESIRSLFQ